MRLQRLDLIRYGHFTDSSFGLPAGKSDFHIVFGPNEAGKSTALAAIEDLLFGIPIHSPYNFRHDYPSMRVGAALENDNTSLEVRRRKGNKDTLLDPNGSPMIGGESVLRRYLAGADRPFFQRMFNLDHDRLQAGGREILEARDDVGQILFSAGAGIAGLRKRLDELSKEADRLWNKRRAKHRRYYIASDKLKEARRALREHTLTSSKWRELKSSYDESENVYAEIDKKIRETTAERNLLSRIRRVLPDVRGKQDRDVKLEALRDVVALPEDAEILVTEAERKDTVAQTRIETLREQLKRAEESLEGLTFDETLVRRSEDVRELHERRIEVRREKADLPKREAELRAAEERLRANASELAWTETDSAALMKQIPPRTKVRVIRDLLNNRGGLEAGVKSHARTLQESREARDGLKRKLDQMGQPADVSRLALVIGTLREQGDLTGRVRAAENAVESAQRWVGRRLGLLNPGDIDEETLTNMAVPTRSMIHEYREREGDSRRRLRETQQKASSVRQELRGAEAALDRMVRDEGIVTGEELNAARCRRDALWNLVKLAHVRGQPITEDRRSGFKEELDDLAAAFEPAMGRADDLADRRFDRAEAAGRATEIRRKIGEQETLLEQARENETGLVEEGRQLNAEWASMWAAAPFDPLAADVMPAWIEAREEVLDAIEEREKAKADLETLREEEHEAKEQLLGELIALRVDVTPLEKDSLNVIIQRAAEEQRLRDAEIAEKADLKKKLDDAAKDLMRRERDLRQAKEARDEWRNEWNMALGALELAEGTAPEAVSAQVDVIDEMRETAVHIRSLRHDRINKINRDVRDFEQVVHELVTETARDLVDRPAENAVLELERRLADAKRVQGLREKKNEEAEGLTAHISELENERRESIASISPLKKEAGAETNEELKGAIKSSDRRRSLGYERQQIINKLEQDGDGKSLEELVDECEGAVIDRITAREGSIQAELEDLRKQQTGAAEKRSQARGAFQAVGGGDAAARAAADEQEALAEMREVAERYTRVKTSAMLLQWAIDRYRRENQAPLLKRAGELFKIVTGGSFSRLQVEFDDRDNPHLTGVRPGGNAVPVSGLSTGTADQLYLALRIASVEHYLEPPDAPSERPVALPFVADDLFINFDDERAAAGFKLLGELSRKTQVLFFTHHLHLVDIARKALGGSVSPMTLADRDAATA